MSLTISPSQIETAGICIRKWWLQSVRKLKTPQPKGTLPGSVFHEVAARYIAADDQGISKKTGQPVELFPAGWHQFYKWGKFQGEIDQQQQHMIQFVTNKAIQEGIIERPFGRLVEQEFEIPVIDDVSIKGLIDVAEPDGVQDHKTTKNMRYAKSKNALAVNPEMLIYAYVLLLTYRHNNQPAPERFKLRHNVLCLDPDNLVVRKTETQVTQADIDKNWEMVKAMAWQMLQVSQRVRNWSELPDPKNVHESCNAFGGCPFMGICTGTESVEGYVQRFDRQQSTGYSLPVLATVQPAKQPAVAQGTQTTPGLPAPLREENTMDFASKIKARQASGAAAPQTMQQAPQQTQPPMQHQPPVQQQYANPAPAPMPNTLTQPQQYQQPPAQQAQVMQQTAPQPGPGVTPLASPAQPPQQETPVMTAPGYQRYVYTGPAVVDGMNVTAPPWQDPICTACGGLGFNSVSKPCKICNLKAKNATPPRPTSDDFDTDGSMPGYLYWQSKTDPSINGLSPISANPTPNVNVQERIAEVPPVQQQPPAPVQQQQPYIPPVQQQVQPPMQQQPPVQHPAPVAPPAPADGEKNKGGRPKKGFTLYVNCAPTKTPANTRKGGGLYVYNLAEELLPIMAGIAKAANVAAFTQIEPNWRRDRLAEAMTAFGATVANDCIVAMGVRNGEASDIGAAVNALSALECYVVTGER